MKNNQKLRLKNVLFLSTAVSLIMFAISAYVWTQIPAGTEVCTHWNAAGACDAYGSKFTGLFLMPIIATGLIGLFTLLPRIEPRATNIIQSYKAYTVVWAVVFLFFLGMHTILMLDVLGHGTNVGSMIPILLGLLLIVIGNYMGKVQSNFFFGIRTPWTLSSELSWNKTHRLGGKLLVLQGIAFIASAILTTGEAWAFWLVASNLAMVVILMAYSYFVWRGDSEAHAH